MRTLIIKKDLYQFEELSEEAQQKAIEQLWDLNIHHEWWDLTYEDAKSIGLNITGFDLDHRNITGEFSLSSNEVAQNILNDHGESCETYQTASSFMEDWQPVFNNYMDESHENYESSESEDNLEYLEDEFLKSLLEDYLIILRNEYEYLSSKESIIESIQANEYEFDIDGNF